MAHPAWAIGVASAAGVIGFACGGDGGGGGDDGGYGFESESEAESEAEAEGFESEAESEAEAESESEAESEGADCNTICTGCASCLQGDDVADACTSLAIDCLGDDAGCRAYLCCLAMCDPTLDAYCDDADCEVDSCGEFCPPGSDCEIMYCSMSQCSYDICGLSNPNCEGQEEPLPDSICEECDNECVP